MYMVIGMEHQSLRLLYLVYDERMRVEIVSQYSTWASGKKNTENMIRHLKGHGINARRRSIRQEIWSGNVQVRVSTDTDDYDAVIRGLETPLL